jgi:hypothetical protein
MIYRRTAKRFPEELSWIELSARVWRLFSFARLERCSQLFGRRNEDILTEIQFAACIPNQSSSSLNPGLWRCGLLLGTRSMTSALLDGASLPERRGRGSSDAPLQHNDSPIRPKTVRRRFLRFRYSRSGRAHFGSGTSASGSFFRGSVTSILISLWVQRRQYRTGTTQKAV